MVFRKSLNFGNGEFNSRLHSSSRQNLFYQKPLRRNAVNNVVHLVGQVVWIGMVGNFIPADVELFTRNSVSASFRYDLYILESYYFFANRVCVYTYLKQRTEMSWWHHTNFSGHEKWHFLCANGSYRGGFSRFRNNHELFERFLGLPSNGKLDNIHTPAASSSTVNIKDDYAFFWLQYILGFVFRFCSGVFMVAVLPRLSSEISGDTMWELWTICRSQIHTNWLSTASLKSNVPLR